MNKLLLALFLLTSVAGMAQSFEGTVTWSVKYDLTDPVKKAQLEKAQQSMNDPANQAKMKQLQEQMNSPQMKQLMDNNPQMKAQMDARMKMMQGDNGMMSAIPKTLIVETKGNSMLSKSEGGMGSGSVTLYDGDKKQSYLINMTAKTYTVMNQQGSAGKSMADSIQHKLTKTSETMKVLDYNCTKYIVEITTPKGETIQQIFWTTTDLKGMDMRNFQNQKISGGGQAMYYKDIPGVPLRIEMQMKEMNMTMEVTGIKKESLPAADFTLPSDFTETKGFMQ